MALFRSSDIGLDLGTSSTLAYVRGKGIVLREATAIAVERGTGKLIAIGAPAKEMLGREPEGLLVVQPLKEGVIANFDAAERMLSRFFTQVVGSRVLFKPRVAIAVPSGATEVEIRAVIEVSEGAGARYTYLVFEPMAAAIGAGLDIFAPEGRLALDIGAGTSDLVVICLGKAVASNSVRVGGDSFDRAIVRYFKRQHGIAIGTRAAEDLKIRFGSACPRKEELPMQVVGRSLGGGMPLSLSLGSNELTYALAEPLSAIVDQIKDLLEQTPPELCGDLTRNGICLSGGSAQLYGFDKYISEQTGVLSFIAEDPAACVAVGAGKVLEDLRRYEGVLYDYRRGDYYEEKN